MSFKNILEVKHLTNANSILSLISLTENIRYSFLVIFSENFMQNNDIWTRKRRLQTTLNHYPTKFKYFDVLFVTI